MSADEDLNQLFVLRKNLGAKALAGVGLTLVENVDDLDDYGLLPSGAVPIGITGGDGVYFALLEIPKRDINIVFMAVPMNPPNQLFVLGESIREFLSLGCCMGYFDLEELAYDPSEIITRLEAARTLGSELDSDEYAALRAIVAEFELKPWTDIQSRLDWLERTYLDDLRNLTRGR